MIPALLLFGVWEDAGALPQTPPKGWLPLETHIGKIKGWSDPALFI